MERNGSGKLPSDGGQKISGKPDIFMVGDRGFEPLTSSTSKTRSSQMS